MQKRQLSSKVDLRAVARKVRHVPKGLPIGKMRESDIQESTEYLGWRVVTFSHEGKRMILVSIDQITIH